MPETVTKQVKNLDPDIYREARAAALKAGVNIGVYISQALKEKLEGPALYQALKRIALEGKREDGKYDKFDASGFVRIAEDAIATFKEID